MKLKENHIFIIYLSSFITFLLGMFFYIPRPRLNNLTPNLNNDNKLIISRTISDSSLSSKNKRNIITGNSYFVLFNNTDSLELTPIAFKSKEDFNLSFYSNYLPELIIDKDQIIFLKSNNYGIDKSFSKEKYQSCLFNMKDKDPFFAYEFNKNNTVYRYHDYDYWISVIKREIKGLLKNVRKENLNCLLITTYNSEIFKNEKDLIKLISDNFIYD